MAVTWTSSTEACRLLGISRATLQNIKAEGLLRPGVHYYRRGIGSRGPLQWDVEAVRQVLINRTRSNPAEVESFALA
jgi:hypothetical protein